MSPCPHPGECLSCDKPNYGPYNHGVGETCGRCEFNCIHGVASDQPCGECMRGKQHLRKMRLFGDATPAGSGGTSEGLAAWWRTTTEDEIAATVPKALEYGSTDLAEIGRVLARVAGRDVSRQDATELGIFFYVQGKMARWVDAVVRGDQVSDDTLHDFGVYIKMAQRNRAVGSWPGEEL